VGERCWIDRWTNEFIIAFETIDESFSEPFSRHVSGLQQD